MRHSIKVTKRNVHIVPTISKSNWGAYPLSLLDPKYNYYCIETDVFHTEKAYGGSFATVTLKQLKQLPIYAQRVAEVTAVREAAFIDSLAQ